MNQKGFTNINIALIVLFIILAGVVGYLFFNQKNPLYQQDIGAFTYLDWTYQTHDGGTFAGKTGYLDYKAQSYSVGYTLPNAGTVNYYAGLIQFSNAKEANTLLTNFLADTNSATYNDAYKSVYKIVDANSSMIIWLHDNILVYIHANPGSRRLDEFLDSAFNIYIKKFPPSLVSS